MGLVWTCLVGLNIWSNVLQPAFFLKRCLILEDHLLKVPQDLGRPSDVLRQEMFLLSWYTKPVIASEYFFFVFLFVLQRLYISLLAFFGSSKGAVPWFCRFPLLCDFVNQMLCCSEASLPTKKRQNTTTLLSIEQMELGDCDFLNSGSLNVWVARRLSSLREGIQ